MRRTRDTQKEKMSPNKWSKDLAKERNRIQNYRKKVKETPIAPKSIPPLPSPYKTPQTIDNTIKRAIQSLPPSSRKKQCIVKRLANEVGLAVASPKKKTKNRLNDDIIAKLKKFL